jgi:hypothetical protein
MFTHFLRLQAAPAVEEAPKEDATEAAPAPEAATVDAVPAPVEDAVKERFVHYSLARNTPHVCLQ